MVCSVERKLLLVAPNIHTGGGLILLKVLLMNSTLLTESIFIFDSRAKDVLLPYIGEHEVFWVKPGVVGRLSAEIFARKREKECCAILCFHNLPTFFTRKKVSVFLQNRLLIDNSPLSDFSFRPRLRISLERFILKVFHRKVARFFVQTESMKFTLGRWLSRADKDHVINDIVIAPFFSDDLAGSRMEGNSKKNYDFVYVSDGQPHKNHLNLLKAWKILAQKQIFPELAITLPDRDAFLKTLIKSESELNHLKIHDLGMISNEAVFSLYGQSGALIFPSKLESFGLPLIEASQYGLPIIAPELDYVRDVCEPAQTFDPNSPASIARAVERFLGYKNVRCTPLSAKQFIQDYL